MICPNCARDIPDDSIMCPYCGYNIRQPATVQRPIVSIPRVNYSFGYSRAGSAIAGIMLIMFGSFFFLFIFSFFPALVQPINYSPPSMIPEPVFGPYVVLFGYKISYMAFPFLAGALFFVILGIVVTVLGARGS
ncbi:MAG: hypothetical protein ACP6IS_08325 [Candidatus Asgardarchaeia archaeon]